MSFFKKMLSSIGIGSAKVDTILQEEQFIPGSTVESIVKIFGGKTEQQIEDLYFSLQTSYSDIDTYEDEDGELIETEVKKIAILDQFKISEPFIIQAGEEIDIPVSFQLPYYTPLTVGDTKVWLSTGLHIKRGKDPSDKDYIHVIPGPIVSAMFEAFFEMGFELVSSKSDAANHHPDGIPFIQEFEFKPVTGPFQYRLEEIELICFPKDNQVESFVEIDRKAKERRGFLNFLTEENETVIRYTTNTSEMSRISEELYRIINKWSE